MSRIQEQLTQHELESLLHDIDYKGFIVVPLHKLYRLLGKGNRAAGTWAALAVAWESIGGKAADLHIAELQSEIILITNVATSGLLAWTDA